MKCTIPEISWHNREPVLSVDISPLENDFYRLATGGSDNLILIWQLKTANRGVVDVDILSELTRHQRAVNVVRWSPNGDFLASGDDDANIILWQLKTDNIPSLDGETNNKETWNVYKVLRCHKEDVYDICWSPNGSKLLSGSVDNTAIIWDAIKGKSERIISDHKSFVQGVAWDPKNEYLATLSSDRFCRVLTQNGRQVKARIGRGTLPVEETHELWNKEVKFFHDDTFKTFFRRLNFSPDGSILIVPSGCVETEDCKNAMYGSFVFTLDELKKPAAILPTTKQCSIAVKCCPLLFELHPNGPKPYIDLPYRIIIAVATDSDVILYDTQQPAPFGHLQKIHYTRLTDLTWSSDGLLLAASSTDGFITLVTFEPGELGVTYVKEASEHETSIISSPEKVKIAEEKQPEIIVDPKPVEVKPKVPTFLEQWAKKGPKRKGDTEGNNDNSPKRVKNCDVTLADQIKNEDVVLVDSHEKEDIATNISKLASKSTTPEKIKKDVIVTANSQQKVEMEIIVIADSPEKVVVNKLIPRSTKSISTKSDQCTNETNSIVKEHSKTNQAQMIDPQVIASTSSEGPSCSILEDNKACAVQESKDHIQSSNDNEIKIIPKRITPTTVAHDQSKSYKTIPVGDDEESTKIITKVKPKRITPIPVSDTKNSTFEESKGTSIKSNEGDKAKLKEVTTTKIVSKRITPITIESTINKTRTEASFGQVKDNVIKEDNKEEQKVVKKIITPIPVMECESKIMGAEKYVDTNPNDSNNVTSSKIVDSIDDNNSTTIDTSASKFETVKTKNTQKSIDTPLISTSSNKPSEQPIEVINIEDHKLSSQVHKKDTVTPNKTPKRTSKSDKKKSPSTKTPKSKIKTTPVSGTSKMSLLNFFKPVTPDSLKIETDSPNENQIKIKTGSLFKKEKRNSTETTKKKVDEVIVIDDTCEAPEDFCLQITDSMDTDQVEVKENEETTNNILPEMKQDKNVELIRHEIKQARRVPLITLSSPKSKKKKTET